ncbi:hypothetical protein Tco_0108522, partial [Tanacetum coccineum]
MRTLFGGKVERTFGAFKKTSAPLVGGGEVEMVVRLWCCGGGVMVRGVGEVVWQRVLRSGVDGDDDIDGGGEWVVVMETARGGAWFGGSDKSG